MKDIVISPPEKLEDFIHARVSSGRYRSPGEVVWEALHLLQRQDEDNLRALRAVIHDGIKSGDGPLLEELSVYEIAERGTEKLKRMRA